jgi:hypothetical protein
LRFKNYCPYFLANDISTLNNDIFAPLIIDATFCINYSWV